ncbi:Nuclear factor of kappa light polypeptide protein enhancer in B-cells inhibitor-like 1 [Desmophyllum pertusum]|uniref:NF-kappa-B inhibitor-like protein 1 n=1 Tax=Desmophyllum pertusum TaxID=174260 RepID=A0A9X0CWI3_9CNID|nr:Nuclear factor of kappa light polypeptide protein enhancer in B-cells inhibitor-like 1 [Desmophyllum pertusum]
MGKSTEEKLFYYIKTGKLHRVRSLFKKYEPSYLTGIVDRQGRTPLHACCLLGDDAIMRLLLKNGADTGITDRDGNTPIHFALKYAIQTVRFSAFDDLIVPLLKACSRHVLDMENNEGKTAKEYVADLKRAYAQRREDREAERKQQWREEHEDMSNKEDFKSGKENYSLRQTKRITESYDDWAERIIHERRRKTTSGKQQKTEENKQHQQQEQKARERTQKLEKEHEAYITRMSIKRQKLKLSSLLTGYENQCQAIFCSNSTTNLKFIDLPWPSGGDTKEMIDLVMKWSELKTAGDDRKKFLKEQQVRWHPDKFLQKCGNRLHFEDREKIIEQVKELSQEINALLEGEF